MDKESSLLAELENAELSAVHGRITETSGMLIQALVPRVEIGELCSIERSGQPLLAEVVGFRHEEAYLSPLGDIRGISPSSEVIPLRRGMRVPAGDILLGRILDAVGNPLDGKGALGCPRSYPLHNSPPHPLQRKIIDQPLEVGVRSIDGLLTCGRGQRIGIFAAAGGGKSTLLGMIAREAQAEVNVISLIGERGREVREFIEQSLGDAGLAKSVVVVSTSDQAAQLRINAAYLGTALAEHFRSQGKTVILMMDSITRFARALREVGLAAGEPPARAGYTPSVFATLPRLLERSGNDSHGSITAFYTILVAGDDLNEPVSDEARSILDGHIVLSSQLAQKFHYPAIDVLRSTSRILPQVADREQLRLIGKVRQVLANYEKNELLVRIGEYKRGSDRDADFAIEHIDKVNRFLQQRNDEKSSMEDTMRRLRTLFL